MADASRACSVGSGLDAGSANSTGSLGSTVSASAARNFGVWFLRCHGHDKVLEQDFADLIGTNFRILELLDNLGINGSYARYSVQTRVPSVEVSCSANPSRELILARQ
jgi:hypothetical protein